MADEWTVTLAGREIPWERIEFTLEQFHLPAQFHVSAPLDRIDIPALLGDKAPEVVIRLDGKDVFVGAVDTSGADLNETAPEGQIVLDGRDLSARFAKAKITAPLPQNLTASEMVTKWAKQHGFTDLQITASSEQAGAFIRQQYSSITKGLSQHDVIFDLAELEHFVFRVHGRQVFFGPQPDVPAANHRRLTYQKDFNDASWRKSHINQDVKIRVMGWNGKKSKVHQEAGSGSLIITRIVPGALTPLKAKALANRLLQEAERFLLTLDIKDMPGDATLNDILYQFKILGVGDGLSQDFRPSKIHHVITQDDHVMDMSLYNVPRKV